MEEEVREVYDAFEGQKRPPPGERPAPLFEVSGPLGRLDVPACPSCGVPSLVAVVMVQEAVHDDATVAFLVSQTMLAEKEAKEVEELVADLDKREQQLLEEIESYRASYKRGAPASRVEVAAAWWWRSKTALAKRATTASPGRYTNTGPAAAQQLDPGGASVTGHRQAP